MDRRVSTLLCCVMFGIPGAVYAEIFRCQQGDGVVYSDRACAPGVEPIELSPLGRMPALEPSELEDDFDRRRARLIQQNRRNDAEWLAEHHKREVRNAQVRNAQVRKAQHERTVIKGMTADEVRGAIGSPDRIERMGSGVRWTYHEGQASQVVTFKAGAVSATRTVKRSRSH